MRAEYDFTDAAHVISPSEFRKIVWTALCIRNAHEVADMCGISPASVRRWLEGTNCPIPAVRLMIKEKLDELTNR
jgi:hypothetical protein